MQSALPAEQSCIQNPDFLSRIREYDTEAEAKKKIIKKVDRPTNQLSHDHANRIESDMLI